MSRARARGLERNGHAPAPAELREVVTSTGDPLVLYRGALAPHEFVTHVHAEFTIGVVDGGTQVFTAAGRVHTAGPGDVVVIGPEVPHDGRPGARAGFAHRSFYVAPSLAARLLGCGGALRDDTRVLRRSPLAASLSTLHDVVARGTVPPEIWEPLLARCLAGALAHEHARHTRETPPVAEPLRRLLASTPPSRALAAQAEAVGVSVRHLRRLCQAATGLSPHRFAMQQRLRRARALLASGVTPARVAFELGFADQAHLTRTFRQTYGVTPARVRGPHMTRPTSAASLSVPPPRRRR